MIFCNLHKYYCIGFLCSADNNEDKTVCNYAKILKVKDNKLKVMPDFSSSGIWDGNTGVMVNYEYLTIEGDLIHEFKEWINYFEDCFKEDFSTFKKGKAKKLNKWGRELAKKLKDRKVDVETGKWEIIYQGEDESGILKPEIIL